MPLLRIASLMFLLLTLFLTNEKTLETILSNIPLFRQPIHQTVVIVLKGLDSAFKYHRFLILMIFIESEEKEKATLLLHVSIQ